MVTGAAEPGDAAGALAEMEDRWRRALADLDNLRKRHAREAGRERQDERNRVAAQWLPVVDNLELALEHADADNPVVQGLKAIHQQAVQVLAHLGYVRHDEVGVPFDPRHHDVVSVVEDPSAAPSTVVHVTSPGYGEDTHQLRPAAVVVSRAPADPGTAE
ncbi:nucleotide exchange factor GrpE [Rhodococcus sp. X156]|uniref:nucleotide exchange factor GrpE n=1 Tax=Rhodococcus sp. X156 TaxID=2499145 RepID=UPI001F49E3BF|nr:nucleotide exchange factor GrpE [Rhodococcus sp. X156]